MNLIVSTPIATAVRTADARHVRAQDASGAFGIWPGHADFLTALSISVLVWRDGRGDEHYLAVRGGMLSVHGGDTVTVATTEVVAGDDLHQLETEVLRQFHLQIDEERLTRTDAQRLQVAAIRQIVRLLRPEYGGRGFGSPSPDGRNRMREG